MLLLLVLVSVASGSPLTTPSPHRLTETLLDSPAAVPDIDGDHNLPTTHPTPLGQHNPSLPTTPSNTLSNPPEVVLLQAASDTLGKMPYLEVPPSDTPQRGRNEGRSLGDVHVLDQTLESRESSKASSTFKVSTPSSLQESPPSVKVTHQVSHVVFEVSEVGPVGSTLPAPTNALKPTEPIPISLLNGRNVSSSGTMAPVFVPKISVDGQPLPPKSKRYHSDRRDSSLIPTELPLVNAQGEPGASLKVVSHYASTSIDSAQKLNATDLPADEVEETNKDATENERPLYTTPESETIPDRIVEEGPSSTPAASSLDLDSEVRTAGSDESRRKEKLREQLSQSPRNPKMSPVLDLVGDERDIELLISLKHLSSARANIKPPTAVGDLSTTTKTSVSGVKVEPEHQVTTQSKAETTTETIISANNFDRGEAAVTYGAGHLLVTTIVPGPSTEALDDLSEHEKTFKREAVGKKVNNAKNKDISSLYEDYEKEDGDLFAEDLPNRDPRIYLNYDKELEDIEKKKQEQQLKEIKAQKEKADVDTNFTETPIVVEEITKTLTKTPPSRTSTSTVKSTTLPDTKTEYPSVDTKKNLPIPIVRTESSETGDVLDEAVGSNVDVPPLIDDDDDVERGQHSSLSDAEYHIASVINTHRPTTNTSGSKSDSSPSPPIIEEDLGPAEGQESNDSFSGRSLQDFAPTAAAVAEAAVLDDLSDDIPQESRSLDSSLTANKRVLQASAPPAPGGPKLARGGSAAPATSGAGIGTLTAIVCGAVVAVLLIIGILLFVLYQRRAFNGPKALGSDRGYAGSDSGGYLDDQCQSSYTNSHLDIPKGCPDDLISLDNDSFLNSLESMTIQNLWTDNIRHTKL